MLKIMHDWDQKKGLLDKIWIWTIWFLDLKHTKQWVCCLTFLDLLWNLQKNCPRELYLSLFDMFWIHKSTILIIYVEVLSFHHNLCFSPILSPLLNNFKRKYYQLCSYAQARNWPFCQFSFHVDSPRNKDICHKSKYVDIRICNQFMRKSFDNESTN